MVATYFNKISKRQCISGTEMILSMVKVGAKVMTLSPFTMNKFRPAFFYLVVDKSIPSNWL